MLIYDLFANDFWLFLLPLPEVKRQKNGDHES